MKDASRVIQNNAKKESRDLVVNKLKWYNSIDSNDFLFLGGTEKIYLQNSVALSHTILHDWMVYLSLYKNDRIKIRIFLIKHGSQRHPSFNVTLRHAPSQMQY